MPTFTGNLSDFEKFIGPATNKVITKLGKTLKKKQQKSCQNKELKDHTVNNEKCGIYKSLDAAHFSHKKHGDRKSIIKTILDKNFKKGNEYEVDLSKFLSLFEKAHQPVEQHLIMLCRRHHSIYDNHNKVKLNERDNVVVEEETVSIDDVRIMIPSKENTKLLKKYLIAKLSYLKDDNCYISDLTAKNKWNFNVPVEAKTGFLLCYNRDLVDMTVLAFKFTDKDKKHFNNSKNIKKDKEHFSFLIPYSETEFIDQKSEYKFELVENFLLGIDED